VAIGDGQNAWFLVNASPDLRSQIESFKALHPRVKPIRNTPLAAIFLTNPDLDHVLGIFSLREGGSLTIYATSTVRRAVARRLGIDKVLRTFGGVTWREPSINRFTPLSSTSLSYRAIASSRDSVAYQFSDKRTGGRLLVAPDVAAISEDLQEAVNEADAVLFDGTFWSPRELAQVKPGARSAEKMGHLPIHDLSLDLLAKAPARHKAYIHINNTNPILARRSPERTAVETAGIVVGYDGYCFEV